METRPGKGVQVLTEKVRVPAKTAKWKRRYIQSGRLKEPGARQNGEKCWKAIGNMRAENCENVANKIVEHFHEATGRIIDNIVALANLNSVE